MSQILDDCRSFSANNADPLPTDGTTGRLECPVKSELPWIELPTRRGRGRGESGGGGEKIVGRRRERGKERAKEQTLSLSHSDAVMSHLHLSPWPLVSSLLLE